MVISNAKYGKKNHHVNRAYMSGWEEETGQSTLEAGMEFVIPRYEELRYLNVEEASH